MKNGTSRRGLAAGAAALGLLLAAGAALAGPAGRRGGAAAGELRGALEALDLSDGQRAKLKELLGEERERREALRRESWDARQALRAAAEAPSPDVAEVGRAYLRLRESRQANVEAREKTKERIASIVSSILSVPKSMSRTPGPGSTFCHLRSDQRTITPISWVFLTSGW